MDDGHELPDFHNTDRIALVPICYASVEALLFRYTLGQTPARSLQGLDALYLLHLAPLGTDAPGAICHLYSLMKYYVTQP
jgi:hypothetical protein